MKEIKVGVLAISSIVILYLGFNFLKGVDFFSSSQKYYVVYKNIDGLTTSNSVTINGFSVGRVSNIQILQDKGNQVLVELSVDKNIPLGLGTKAILSSSDFLGSKAIVLDIMKGERLQNGDTLIAEVEKGISETIKTTIKETITKVPLLDALDGTVKNLNIILGGIHQNKGDMYAILHNFKETSKHIKLLVAENRRNLKTLNQNLSMLSDSLNNKETGIPPMMRKVNSIADKVDKLALDKTVTDLNKTLSSLDKMLTSLNQGEGTLGKLIKDDTLYTNLNNTLIEITDMVNHLEKDPNHFFAPLGKKPKKNKNEDNN